MVNATFESDQQRSSLKQSTSVNQFDAINQFDEINQSNQSNQSTNNRSIKQSISQSFESAEQENIFLRHYIVQCDNQIRRLLASQNQNQSLSDQSLNQSINQSISQSFLPEWLQSSNNQQLTQLPALIQCYEAHIAELDSESINRSERINQLEDELEETLLSLKAHVEQSLNESNVQSTVQSIDSLKQETLSSASQSFARGQSFEDQISALKLELNQLFERASAAESKNVQSDRTLSLLRQYEVRSNEHEVRLSSLIGEKALVVERMNQFQTQLNETIKARDEFKVDSEEAIKVTLNLESQLKSLTKKRSMRSILFVQPRRRRARRFNHSNISLITFH